MSEPEAPQGEVAPGEIPEEVPQGVPDDQAAPAEDAATESADTESADTESSETDFEGPRRRARREREQRRAAQQRARAIEEARREAKRRASGLVPPAAPTGRGKVRGLRAVLLTVLLIILGVGVGSILYFTPVMSVRAVAVVGTAEVPIEEVTAVAAVPLGTPLLQVNTGEVADRVATIRRVASARVQREYPSTLRITIAERVPVAVMDFPDGPHLYDRDGVDFATAPPPPSLPYLEVANPGPTDPPTQAALAVLTSLRPEVAGQVGRVAAPSVASITLILTDGREVVWGTHERTEEKAEKLAALLTQPGHTYDVSSPDLPTVK
ncbi:cell division protein FtsQ/DivIB [Mycolicibacterium sp.]|uniref:cell division protein FtsQ/DivIB n=1 Tax=Mycolicibacterium sp. TaxID=2320850 RepID=UPI003564D322